jgi:uncharacterized protein YecE (DUF72 family)
VLTGTCGWSDSTLLRCGKFYPSSVKNGQDRLRHYSRIFPCVEVDSSNYSIPSTFRVSQWLAAVPSGFIFHFKIFSLLLGIDHTVTLATIPRVLRDTVTTYATERLAARIAAADGDDSKVVVAYQDLGIPAQQALWQYFNDALRPAAEKNALGVIVVQYPTGFKPNAAAYRIITECRNNLAADYAMAVEFRDRSWFEQKEQLPHTIALLRSLGAAIIGSDDLHHELFGREFSERKVARLPLEVHTTGTQFMYFRVHRRQGCHRELSQKELQDWHSKINDLLHNDSEFQGPIFMMFGTDWEMAPITNMRNMSQMLGEDIESLQHWKKQVRMEKGSLFAMFAKQKQKKTQKPQQQPQQQPQPVIVSDAKTPISDTTTSVDPVRTSVKRKILPASSKPLTSPVRKKKVKTMADFFSKKKK